MTSKEQLQRIPASPLSVINLRAEVFRLTEKSGQTDYGFFAQFITLPNETVRVFDFTDFNEEVSPIPDSKIRIFIHEDLGGMTKTTIYKVNPDKYSIERTEIVEPNETRTEEELEEMAEQAEENIREVEEKGWYSFLRDNPEKRKRMMKYFTATKLENELGLTFVSEAEIQDLIRKLRLIDLQSHS